MTTAALDSIRTNNAAADENVRRIGKTRVQVDLSPRAMALLAELKQKTDAASYTEVLKNALKLYDGIVAEAERGAQFLVRDKDGNVSEFRMFL